MVEASLGLLLFLTMIFGLFDFAFPMFIRLGLHYATREGARYAITGNTMDGIGTTPRSKRLSWRTLSAC